MKSSKDKCYQSKPRASPDVHRHSRVTRRSLKMQQLEDDMEELSNQEGRHFIDRRVRREIGKVIMRGTVIEYMRPDSPEEPELWLVEYDDNDKEHIQRDELIHSIEAYETEARGLACVRLDTFGSVACGGKVDKVETVTRARMVRKFTKRKDGLYDMADVPVSSLSALQRKKDELFKLGVMARNMDNDEEGSCENVDIQSCDPLSKTRIAEEVDRECWEKVNCSVRPFRPFSNGVGVKQKSNADDVAFRAYALENDILMQFIQNNPKRKMIKGELCQSWERYERYKVANTLKEMIGVSVACRRKGMTREEAKA
jgi:hypothetical protein